MNKIVFAGPAVMELDPQVLARLSEVIRPLGVIRPIAFDFELVNQIAPSGPAVTPVGARIVGPVKEVIVPRALIRPIELLPLFMNQRGRQGGCRVAGEQIEVAAVAERERTSELGSRRRRA